MKDSRKLAAALVAPALILVLAAGCGRSKTESGGYTAPTTTTPAPPVVPQAVATLGSSVDAQNRILIATERFRPSETIYVSVATAQTPAGSTLRARWLDAAGTVINEASQTVVGAAGADTEFHISKPDGWPAGTYKVELSLNGQPLTTKTFVVNPA